MFAAVAGWLGRSVQTSETKAVLMGALWATCASLVPGVPMSLPDIDLSAVGMGILTLSPAFFAAYAIVRCAIKVVTDGQVPFQPNPKPEVPVA